VTKKAAITGGDQKARTTTSGDTVAMINWQGQKQLPLVLQWLSWVRPSTY